MKIKLRDITNEQYDKWKQGCKNRACENCPIRIVNRMVNCAESSVNYSWIDHKGNFSNKFLDQEIEINVEDEKIQLTEDEKAALRLLAPKYKYIARDADTNLYVYYNKPTKAKVGWTDHIMYGTYNEMCAFNHCFKDIQWTDDEPALIADLLK